MKQVVVHKVGKLLASWGCVKSGQKMVGWRPGGTSWKGRGGGRKTMFFPLAICWEYRPGPSVIYDGQKFAATFPGITGCSKSMTAF